MVSSFSCSSLDRAAIRDDARQTATRVMSQPIANDADATKGLSKVEGSAVKRFATAYDKLCKSCPTTLRPRVDTLTEMILGLPDEERRELADAVARRLEGEEESGPTNGDAGHRRVRSSRDVYEYQITGAASAEVERKAAGKRRTAGAVGTASADETTEETDVVDAKKLRRMRKARAKFDSNKRGLARARRLLAVTNALLSKEGRRGSEPTIYTVANPVDNAWYHDVDDLKAMSRGELKMERLKLMAQRAKCESKVAKGRLKLYKASVDLMDHVK
eukprot:CAMPEP_0172542872 /NCGR_PEP_ID=MMETSP1067-20121228/13392_1 /TAXON_ID=265564 ORGANISM="Thalassiosira punctigera, Strain Tpunct2005C2" /NCGR_SAMPLE_ID=MMETSP1067 /ASSEMBLY_ACC=CAM_ASM_000444 /LENGTH=274 /DNA_ID=CAMNT_0013329175 /DNA_START=67 /DNA_END=891 /DNA_ORIENTATION=+